MLEYMASYVYLKLLLHTCSSNIHVKVSKTESMLVKLKHLFEDKLCTQPLEVWEENITVANQKLMEKSSRKEEKTK